MQADNIEAGAKDLVKKLTNLNSIEAHSAINQYFDNHAVLQSTALEINGAERIKKQLDMFNHVFGANELVADPKYSEKDQTIHFVVARPIQARLPQLLKSIPFASELEKHSMYMHYKGVLHLMPDGSDDQGSAPMLYVTKVDLRQKEQPPLSNLIPYYLLRPFFSIVSNVIATVAAIVVANPWTAGGLVSMISSLVNSFWLWVYDKVADAKEVGLKKNPSWANGAGADLPKLMGDSRAALANAAKMVEDRAKQMGVPVEQYKAQAREVYEQATRQGAAVVKDATAQAGQAMEKGAKKAEEVTSNDSTRPEDKEDSRGHQSVTKSSMPSDKPANNDAPITPSDHSEHDLPQTPFGGTDPTAPEAPSYADITVDSHSQGSAPQKTLGQLGESGEPAAGQEKTINEDLPHTPLGGTDPLADGAPSYAQAAHEQ